MVLVPLEDVGALSTPPDSDAAIQALRGFASQADVLPVTSDQLHPAITRTRILVDLAPLLNADPINSHSDFYPALLQSFQRDGGLWALPVSGSIIAVLYDAAAFDAAGLGYPNAHWTIEDFVRAAKTLVQRDRQGRAIAPGVTADTGALFRVLLGRGFYDSNAIPAAPDLSNNDLAQLLESWRPIAHDNQQARQQGFSLRHWWLGA